LIRHSSLVIRHFTSYIRLRPHFAERRAQPRTIIRCRTPLPLQRRMQRKATRCITLRGPLFLAGGEEQEKGKLEAAEQTRQRTLISGSITDWANAHLIR